MILWYFTPDHFKIFLYRDGMTIVDSHAFSQVDYFFDHFQDIWLTCSEIITELCIGMLCSASFSRRCFSSSPASAFEGSELCYRSIERPKKRTVLAISSLITTEHSTRFLFFISSYCKSPTDATISFQHDKSVYMI